MRIIDDAQGFDTSTSGVPMSGIPKEVDVAAPGQCLLLQSVEMTD